MPVSASRRPWIIAGTVIVLAAIAMRAAANFSHGWPPGHDSAYYPLQTRSWLVDGRLMYVDLPLFFWLNAALAKLLMAFGLSIDNATLLGSRLIDCVAQPLTAAVLMAIAYDWSGGRTRALAGSAAAAAIAVLSPAAAHMASEMQKNAMGLLWMALAWWCAGRAMRRGGARHWLALMVVMAASALTHIGAFALTWLTISTALVVWIASQAQGSAKNRFAQIIALAAASALLVALVAWFDPSRASFLATPLSRLGAPSMGFGGAFRAGISILCALVAVLSARRWWPERRNIDASQSALVLGVAASAFLLAAPLTTTYGLRLSLMAPTLVALLLIFLTTRRALTNGSSGPTGVLVAASVALALSAPAFFPRQLMPRGGTEELSGLRTAIGNSRDTLVLAPSGLTWSAAFLLNTAARLAEPADLAATRLPARLFSSYRRVVVVGPAAGDQSFQAIAAHAPADLRFHVLHGGPVFAIYEVERLRLDSQ